MRGSTDTSETLSMASHGDHNHEKDVERDAEQLHESPPESSLQSGIDEKATNPPQPASQDPYQAPNDSNIVTWDGPGDPENPQNWSPWTKWSRTMFIASMTLVVTFASSVFSTGTIQVSEEFHISTEVSTLGTSLFVLGFGLGPSVWGPLSEIFGRMRPLYFSYFCFAVFQIPVAVAQNVETIMLCRFLSGFFGVGPLAITGGIMVDIFGPVDRGIAIAVFAAATFIGPMFGPVIGGFIVDNSSLGWRWTSWITLIMAAFFGTTTRAIVPETFGPVLLKRRAQRLRHETKNWALHAKIEESRTNMNDIVSKYLTRPAMMIVLEPILLLLTIYMALIYGILYLFFEAFPITFQQERGWNDGVGALPFFSLFVGVLLGASCIFYTTKTRYARIHREHGKVAPEERLIPMMIGGVTLPAGLFWFAWTSSPHITWVPQVLSGIPIGFGVYVIFLQGLNYIVDVYLMFANSAIAANTFLRSLFGAGFPLFAVQMYHKLGVPWATTLLAFLCVAMAPVPFLFWKFGDRIRAMSKFAPKL